MVKDTKFGELSSTTLISEDLGLDAEALAAGLQASQRRKKISLILAAVGAVCVVVGCVVAAAVVLTSGGGDETPAPVDEAYTPSPRMSYPSRLVFSKSNWNSYDVDDMPEVYKDFGAIMEGCSGVLRIDQICGWKQGKENMAVVKENPKGSDYVMQIKYPQGEYGTEGGAQFYQQLKDLDKGAMVEYEVYFPGSFDFVMGGKLPGFHGGNLQCSGYSEVPDGYNCFSTRLMWRENGAGEAYMYVPLELQNDDFCKQCTYPVGSKCSDFEDVENCSWNRGDFKFKKDSWNRVAQYIKMNTPGQHDGVFEVYTEGTKRMSYSQLLFRKSDSLHLEGLFFSTFMGGHSRSYAPAETQVAYFRNFKVYAN